MAAVVHDLRNPLSAIALLIRRLEQAGAPGIPEVASRLRRQVRRLEALTYDITDRAQVQTERLVLERAVLDLSAVTREVAEDMAGLAGTRHLCVECPPSCPVQGDPRRIERILWNLVSNAIKYSGPGTEVRIRVEAREGMVRIEVRDQGIGMSQETIQGLFRPFGRAAGAHQMARGSGLGLYSVKKFVEAHGGTIQLLSAPGAGTTIIVALPRAEAAERVTSRRSAAAR